MSEDEDYKIPKNEKLNTENLIVPENQRLWDKEHPMSKECKEIIEEINALTYHLLNLINHGPELGDNSAKRVMVAKAVMKSIITYTFMTPIDRLGILEAIKDDLNMEARAKAFKNVLEKSLEDQEKKDAKVEKSKRTYVS